MTMPPSADNWSKHRKANVGDQVTFVGRKDTINLSGKFVKQHLNHIGSVLSHKRRMADTGLSTKHYYLLKCEVCADSEPDWVLSHLFDKKNI